MTTLLDAFMGNIIFLGTELYNLQGLGEMLSRFLLNTVFVFLISRYFYYPKSRRRDYFFTFLLFSVSIFMLIYLMDGAKMKVGAALGLFAVFGIIRYRTESVPIRDMTYLFVVVAVSVVNGMSVNLSVAELLVANLLFIAMAWFAESSLILKPTACKYVRYDNIELITPARHEEMIADLEKRLGVRVVRVEIGSVDFLRDSALIKVHYIASDKGVNSVDTLPKLPKDYE